MNEEASDKVLEVEQKYNEVRRPIYQKRNEVIQGIADFWLTAVSVSWSFLYEEILSEMRCYRKTRILIGMLKIEQLDSGDLLYLTSNINWMGMVFQ